MHFVYNAKSPEQMKQVQWYSKLQCTPQLGPT